MKSQFTNEKRRFRLTLKHVSVSKSIETIHIEGKTLNTIDLTYVSYSMILITRDLIYISIL